MLKQSRASETLSYGVTRQRRSLSPAYNAVLTSPTLYKAEVDKQSGFKYLYVDLSVDDSFRFPLCLPHCHDLCRNLKLSNSSMILAQKVMFFILVLLER